ncbi:hypothetical protein LG634_22950 [Streptomyces bambusae]|uniref:HGxxPAAW family protein n=1 Tax=Streptomyces bambusae TaxID=1550616 RepID=UPI001CFD537E|nr:HGxxPAAW family protein [Streptomyces bambusae]MCB5167676.1 hypothetical protein [Streptomyces bambusae]
MSGHQYDEGHTVAGWSGTAVTAVGSALAGVGVCGWTPGLWLGGAVLLGAAVLTWVLHLAGWGKTPGPRPAAAWGFWTRDHSARGGHADCLGCRLAGRGRTPAAVKVRAAEPVTANAGDPAS